VISGREGLTQERVESLGYQGFSPVWVRISGGWRGWREGMGDFPDITSPLGWDFREQDSGMMNLSPINNQQSTINNQQSTIGNQQSTINNQQSTIINHQSTIINHQSSINNHQSSIHLIRVTERVTEF
jgi:hypothetical protein